MTPAQTNMKRRLKESGDSIPDANLNYQEKLIMKALEDRGIVEKVPDNSGNDYWRIKQTIN